MTLNTRHYLTAGTAVLLAAAFASSAVAAWGTDPVTVPERTPIHVTLDQTVATSERSGHHFRATVSRPVVIEGKTVIPKGAHAEGVVVEAKEAGRFKGRPQLLLARPSVDVSAQPREPPWRSLRRNATSNFVRRRRSRSGCLSRQPST